MNTPTLEELIENPVRAFPQEQWHENNLPPRLAKVKARLLNDERMIDIEPVA